MDCEIGTDAEAKRLVAAALAGQLTDEQAEVLAGLGHGLLSLVLLAASKRIAELESKLHVAGLPDPATPSGQKPLYTKPRAPKSKHKPGARKGHAPSRRKTPERIDRREDHRLEACPDCGGPLQRCNRSRPRKIEDILEDLRTEVVEHTIHRDYCPTCRKHVEPVVPDALPKAAMGHRIMALTGWLHYGLGVTISQVIALLGHLLQTRLSAGGLMAMWTRLALILEPWYEQIGHQARASAVLHADETGCRVNGQTWWLWCFANGQVCYYMIDRSRGSPALEKFFVSEFDGVLITDFWAAYNAVNAADRQCCLVHLLRELEKVDQHNESAQWQAFAKKLRRLIGDGIRLRKRQDYTPQRYASRVHRIDQRLMALARAEYADADASRLGKRLLRHADQLFTFLDYPDVAFENNFAERMIRPAVIIRKTCQGNRSEKAAAVQAMLMSIYRTLKLRGRDPIAIVANALRTYVQTGTLPPLPEAIVADG
jgi:transposase